MRGIGDKQAYLLKTKVTVDDAPGETLTAGATITFPKPFTNIPCGCVVCVKGSVDLEAVPPANQPASVWTVTCTTDECEITLESALPSVFHGVSFIVGVFVHEQL